MNEVHIVMQGKGGVGKSYVALHLAQYLKGRDPDTICIDTDPLTPTLSRFSALNPRYIAVSDQAEVHLDKFDAMMQLIAEATSDVIIDTGASTFLPISQYMLENDVIGMLLGDFGKTVTIHVVINGKTNNDLHSTVTCFSAIVAQFPAKVGLNVWLNEYGGVIKTPDGHWFEELGVYLRHKDRVGAIVKIVNPTTTEMKDITAMQNARMTYAEVRQSPEFHLMAKSRLYRTQKAVFEQLDLAAPSWTTLGRVDAQQSAPDFTER